MATGATQFVLAREDRHGMGVLRPEQDAGEQEQ